MSKRFIILAFVAVVMLLAVYAVFRGSYPVMFVNGSAVLARTFEEKYAAALVYYRSALATYADAPSEFGAEEKRELKRAVLENLAEEILIHQELLRLEPEKLSSVVENKVAEALKNLEFADAALALYGLNPENAKRYLLVPQAEREILEGRLFLENLELEQWLAEAKRWTSVIMLLPGFSWKDGGVVAE